jgi:hypothetical protein
MTRSRRLLPLAVAASLAFALPLAALPSPGFAQGIGVSITVAPPLLPVYAQPVIPGDGYIWQPGYWAWGPGGYYWVPGTWVLPPAVGLLWTPGYWGWLNGAYLWHAGYWGPHVGFYGGINYGYGYGGVGYSGGRWDNGRFFYNRAVNNFGRTHIANVYNQPVRNPGAGRVSFNGGSRGNRAQPNAVEGAAANEPHVDRTPLQTQHEQAAIGRHGQFASANHGRPPIAATARPATFTGRGIVSAQPQHAPQARPAQAPAHAAPRPAPGGNRGDGHDHP